MAMSSNPAMQVHPGRGLGFLVLGASLHDVLTRLKAQVQVYPSIDVSLFAVQASCCPCHTESTSEWHSSTIRWT
ncbi:hypothetical protein HO173_013325 [Letharia columbiana]|uniref:Uncharacterized protein n=1 Tax=Letharia columbiana TaxID=112416 RepID=A0A8H6CGI4_9LECA|nr:uncharacterized protein HO173_013325 [Letharia columbiana]KAF6223112.1 hypothetical protein HO173_013325 [Letharia columbiana]